MSACSQTVTELCSAPFFTSLEKCETLILKVISN